MTDLPPVRKNITVQETDFRKATAESTYKKFGKSVNFINERQFQEKGFYANGPYPATGVNEIGFDGGFIFPEDSEIFAIAMKNDVAGSGGSTTFDLLVAAEGSTSFSTIFTTKPAIASTAGAFARIRTGGSGTGLTAPVLITTPFLVNAYDYIRADFTSKQTGNAQNAGIIIYHRPR